jgi:hypothetical protein
MAYVRPNSGFISAHRRYEISTCPEVLSYEVPLTLSVDPRQVNRTFSFDITDHLRHRVFRRYRYHHVNVVRHQMAFFYPALLPSGQVPEDFSKMPPQFNV